MALSPTANMSLEKPEPNVTLGPDWAQKLNDALDLIDAHDHSSGKGVKITPAGLNINADLPLNENDITLLRTAAFVAQAGTLSTVDKRALYAVGGDLYWNNGSGGAVQVTNGSAVVSSISGAFATKTPGGYPYTVVSGDAQKVILVDTGSARTINLPAATTAILFCIRDSAGQAGTNNITVAPNGLDTIEGVNANYTLKSNNGWWFFISDGVGAWYVTETSPQIIPAGTIQMYGGATAPSGWLICDGSIVSETTYAGLYAAIGDAYETGGEGAGNFRLPDLRQRFPMGKAASGTGSTLGGSGGTIDHTHSVPAHYHGMGTGADLNITASGSHTHAIDHDHASFTSGAEGAHTHTINHDHASFTSGAGSAHSHSIDHNHASATTSSDGDHYHFMMSDEISSTTPTAATVGFGRSYTGAGGIYAYDLKASVSNPVTQARTSTDGAHTHTLDLPNHTGSSGSESSHTHTIDVPAFTGSSGVGSSHTHSIDVPAFSGASGAATHTHASGDVAGRVGLVTGGVDGNAAMTSGTANPPFQTVNFIIKA